MQPWRNKLAERALAPEPEPMLQPEFAGDGLEYLQSVYRNPALEQHVRIRAAALAVPFERPKLSAVAQAGPDDFADMLERTRRNRLARDAEYAQREDRITTRERQLGLAPPADDNPPEAA